MSNSNGAEGFAALVALVAVIFVFAGFGARKSPERLASPRRHGIGLGSVRDVGISGNSEQRGTVE
jgi:hypothetical protein